MSTNRKDFSYCNRLSSYHRYRTYVHSPPLEMSGSDTKSTRPSLVVNLYAKLGTMYWEYENYEKCVQEKLCDTRQCQFLTRTQRVYPIQDKDISCFSQHPHNINQSIPN